MTKKQFIWLGIRAIGIYWLLILLRHVIDLAWIAGYWGLSKMRGDLQGSFTLTWVSRLMSLPEPLLLSVYFLLFGTLIYKLIDRCVRSQQEDLTKPTGYCYCEIIVRFLGLSFVYIMVSVSITLPLRTCLQSVLMMFLNRSTGAPSGSILTPIQYFRHPGALLSMAMYLVFAAFFGWYFLKKGTFFINLLNRLWLKAAGNNSSQSPAGVM